MTMTNPRDQILHALQLLIPAGQVVELRAPRYTRPNERRRSTASGYYNDLRKMADDAAKIDGHADAIYFTLNALQPALLARANNHLVEGEQGKSTADKHVLRRTLLLIDADPLRPGGITDISSSNEEHAAALERAAEIRQWLTARGWPEPVTADSGNGGHLLYAIDLPNDDASTDLLKRVLQAVAVQWDDAVVTVDTGVYNASRICKLYGTQVKKGDSMPERPHRRSAILATPADWQLVSDELLAALAAEAPAVVSASASKAKAADRPAPAPRPAGSVVEEIKARFDLLAYATEHFGGEVSAETRDEVRVLGNGGLHVNRERGIWCRHSPKAGGDAIDLVGYIEWGEAWDRTDKVQFQEALAIAGEYAGVPITPQPDYDPRGVAICPDHRVPLVPAKRGGYYCPTRPTGEMPHFYWTGQGYTPPTASTSSAPRPAAPAPQPATAPRSAAPPATRPPEPPPPGGDPPAPARKLLHADELGTLPKPQWLIQGLLATNKLHEIFGAPGSGKSHINLDIAESVAQFAPVVYLAGEDVEDYAERHAAWQAHHRLGSGQLHFWPDPVNLLNMDHVQAFLAEVLPIAPALIIIDTLATCMVGADENSTKDMGIALESLNYIRRQTGAAILVTHHSGWNDTHERGNSSLRGAVRMVAKVKMDDEGFITLSCEKMNGAKMFEPRYFRLIEVGNSVAILPSSKIITGKRPLTAPHYDIMEALRLTIFEKGASYTQLLDHLAYEKNKGGLNRRLSKLEKEGYLERHPDKLYFLTALGGTTLDAHLEGTEGSGVPMQFPQQFANEFATVAELGLNWPVCLAPKTPGSVSLVPLNTAHQSAEVPLVPTQFHTVSEQTVPVPFPPPSLKGGTRNTEEGESAQPPTVDPTPPPANDYDHDKARVEEARQYLAVGDWKSAKRAAERIRGNVDRRKMLSEVEIRQLNQATPAPAAPEASPLRADRDQVDHAEHLLKTFGVAAAAEYMRTTGGAAAYPVRLQQALEGGGNDS